MANIVGLATSDIAQFFQKIKVVSYFISSNIFLLINTIDRDCNKMWAFDLSISAKSNWPFSSQTKCCMIMILYDMKFRITSFDMIEPSPCVLLFPMYFLVSTQKTEANFLKFFNGTPTSITDVTKILSHFLL